ncbi:thioesterase family protein [Marinobacterium rhizophilum]|uniref:Thioesterase family protein n=1 Tax=Marinobacterium rhizophilum TaxID=420402 RepID=A0ABY5HF14_9GAMM|nr:thioesterase family protein [Marinobacterium rhizophilum]UTW10948.1 thioesterase family protein [Marinobacterium rhizophilum]
MATELNVFDGPVQPEWIDYNGHMNDACYVLVFSQAIDEFMVKIGLDESFRSAHQASIYTLQSMVHYLQEVSLGEPLRVSAQLLESDAKKLRVFFTMQHGESGDVLAAMETLLLHMDMAAHRAAPMLADTAARVEALRLHQADLEWPALAGRSIALTRPRS